ncbi:MAG: UvrD-helicase domain-containing protein, partial [Bacteroidales bacterium]|nr:UvrD-helicase domain-containing protein [Bacteroidales bacterium]
MGILKIYKASAGSGKTHRLTQEYINLIMSSSDSYRHILAVTFTNKATAEMKSRILQELFKKSQSDPQINQRLISILHDYSSFNISTIDKFFQSTLRAFARESNLNSSYGVELDDNMVISEAVDRVINSLDLPENQELLEWFINFTLSTADEGKSWDIRREIEKKIDNFT